MLFLAQQSAKNYNAKTFSPPFFMGANKQWYYNLGNRVFGPFSEYNLAVESYQAERLMTEGVR